jgi:hypothetical protein
MTIGNSRAFVFEYYLDFTSYFHLLIFAHLNFGVCYILHASHAPCGMAYPMEFSQLRFHILHSYMHYHLVGLYYHTHTRDSQNN